MFKSLFSRLFCANKRRISFAAESRTGLVREKNEDSFSYVCSDGARNAIFVVADGIGGHADGEVASAMCCASIEREWKKNKACRRQDVSEMSGFLTWLVENANAEIYRINRIEQRPKPMGCTVVAAMLTPEYLMVAHAGDSRCYAVGPGGMRLLTTDHTLRAAVLSRSHESLADEFLPPPSIINKAVGPSCMVAPTVSMFKRSDFSRIMLCTDGLSGMLSDDGIAAILCGGRNPKEITGDLVCAALKSGGRDNVTVITVFC